MVETLIIQLIKLSVTFEGHLCTPIHQSCSKCDMKLIPYQGCCVYDHDCDACHVTTYDLSVSLSDVGYHDGCFCINGHSPDGICMREHSFKEVYNLTGKSDYNKIMHGVYLLLEALDHNTYALYRLITEDTEGLSREIAQLGALQLLAQDPTCKGTFELQLEQAKRVQAMTNQDFMAMTTQPVKNLGAIWERLDENLDCYDKLVIPLLRAQSDIDLNRMYGTYLASKN